MLAVREGKGAEGRHVPALELAPILLSNLLGQQNKLPEQSKSKCCALKALGAVRARRRAPSACANSNQLRLTKSLGRK